MGRSWVESGWFNALIAVEVRLVCKGDGWRGECPSHPDPEQHVHDEAGGYVCFNCRQQGDVIDRVMKAQAVSEEQVFVPLANVAAEQKNMRSS